MQLRSTSSVESLVRAPVPRILLILLSALVLPWSADGQHDAPFHVAVIPAQWGGGNIIVNFSSAITLDPKNPTNYYNRAVAMSIPTQDVAGTIADCAKAIELSPQDQNFWDARSKARLAKGDKVGAAEDCAKAEKLPPHKP